MALLKRIREYGTCDFRLCTLPPCGASEIRGGRDFTFLRVSVQVPLIRSLQRLRILRPFGDSKTIVCSSRTGSFRPRMLAGSDSNVF